MDSWRRRFLKNGAASAVLLPLVGSGLLKPNQVFAAPLGREIFTIRHVQDALKAYGAGNAADSRDIAINAPEIAENGAKVEVEITSGVPNTRSIAIFADKNPLPLCAAVEFGSGVLPFCRLQLKLAETTRIRVVARTADGKNHIASREIKVTLGGCGA